jgi:hypothetical protein
VSKILCKFTIHWFYKYFNSNVYFYNAILEFIQGEVEQDYYYWMKNPMKFESSKTLYSLSNKNMKEVCLPYRVNWKHIGQWILIWGEKGEECLIHDIRGEQARYMYYPQDQNLQKIILVNVKIWIAMNWIFFCCLDMNVALCA